MPHEEKTADLDLEEAFKQFSVETAQLESSYQILQERFNTLQADLHKTHTQLYSKLAEFDFVTTYLDAILHHISQGILFIDLSGMITTYNSAAEEALGIKQAEALFHPFWALFPDTIFGFSVREALESGKSPKSSFASWVQPSGEVVELEIDTTLLTLESHTCPLTCAQPAPSPIQGMLILIRNITEIRKLQLLANRHHRLEELGEMAAKVAHEIRNPLGSIRGFASLLHQDLEKTPQLQQMAASIVEGTDHLNRLVSNILNFARPVQLHLEIGDLVPFLQDILQLVQVDEASPPNVLYSFQCPFPSLSVPFDPQLLKSVLLNLLVNAVQAMPDGGTVTIALNKNDSQILIDVRDTGVGIPEENLEKIFSPFFTTKEKGNGFGLSEVLKTVQAFGGIIEVHSQLGQGTIFRIKIPLKK